MSRISGFPRRLLAGLTAAAAAVFAVSFPANAAVSRQFAGYLGDVNGDLLLDTADAVLLSRHLTADEPLGSSSLCADLDGNGRLNTADLTLLQNLLCTNAAPEAVYTETLLPDAPIDLLAPSLPARGESKILLFAVDFPDCARSADDSAAEIRAVAFGPQNPDSPLYPMESISAYYERASYGRLHLTGDIYEYTAKYGIDRYVNDYELLLDEIMAALDSEIDYRMYDANGDALIDTVLVVLPGSADETAWWPCSGAYIGRAEFDGMQVGNICIGSRSPSDSAGFNSTWIHELGHAMGLPDYYRYANFQGDAQGMGGDAGWEMMDDAFADMSAFSKLMCGWIAADEVQIYTGGTQTFTLRTAQDVPDCILIPRGELDGFLSEYFLIELNTADMNNLYTFYENVGYPIFEAGGVRILHCNAETWYGTNGYEFKWNNFGQNYDPSNNAQRVLRLVNDRAGFFGGGSVIGGGMPGFAWYGADGGRSLDPGVTVTVDGISEDGRSCMVTVSQNN